MFARSDDAKLLWEALMLKGSNSTGAAKTADVRQPNGKMKRKAYEKELRKL
jgi:hypothetical protein